MPEKKEGSKNKDQEERKTIFNRLFSKPSRNDEDYMSDLQLQWAELDTPGRMKFVLGAIIGLILFIGALILSYLALSALVG